MRVKKSLFGQTLLFSDSAALPWRVKLPLQQLISLTNQRPLPLLTATFSHSDMLSPEDTDNVI